MIPFLTHWIKSVGGGWGGVGWCGGGGGGGVGWCGVVWRWRWWYCKVLYLAGACVIRILIRTAHRRLPTGRSTR